MGFTWKHILYLIVMMTIGAALLDAIINGGLAALMYHDQVRSFSHSLILRAFSGDRG
jgi:hypothetical protein